MFYLEAPLESDKQSSESVPSESVKNLNEFSYYSQTLCQSDSNIPGSCAKSASKKRQRWRGKPPPMRYQTSLSLKIRYRIEKENLFERAVKRSKEAAPSADTGIGLFPEKKVNLDANDVLPPELSCYQAHDIEFVDACRGGSQEIAAEEDCVSSDGTGDRVAETQNQKSENRCLKNTTSINNIKAINNSFVGHPTSGALKEACDGDVSTGTDPGRDLSSHGKAQLVLHLNSDFRVSSKSDSRSDTNLLKLANKSLKRQKINSGTSFLSLCSLFSLSKSPIKSPEEVRSGSVGTEFREQGPSVALQQNAIATSLSCCPLSFQRSNGVPAERPQEEAKNPIGSNIVIINKSPKPINQSLFPEVRAVARGQSLKCKSGSFSSDSSSADTSSDGMAPIASPEVTSPSDSALSSPKLMDGADVGPFRDRHKLFKESSRESSAASTPMMGCGVPAGKLKLLHEGDAQVCYLSHTRTIFRKVLSSKLLRRWETHHIYLTEDCLCSKTSTGFLESPIPYSNMDEVYAVGRWDHRNRFCIRLVMADGSLLLQTSNSLVRDQWLSSILWKKNMHKYKNILRSSTRPEVILKEIKGIIYSSLNLPLQDDCIRSVPIEIISKVLSEDRLWGDRQRTEEVIVALAPLLEDSTPSPEMFQFFSRHCLSHPRSPVVVDVFTSVVQRILKRTMDFSKSPLMRRFVADYFKALHSQNDGEEAIRKFITSVHGTSFGCPHPRVLPNLVAVNLAAVFSHFEQRKALLTESANESNCNEALQLLDKQLECFVTLFLAISEYEDWRSGLAQLLQPIPFPDDALSHHGFIKGFSPVMRKIGTDPRCEVHETVLGIRENKEGWLNVFCPSSLVCKDDGVLWCQMLETLFYCCCRRKSFLQKMVKHLGALLLVALRGHVVAQDMLCLMLEWRLINGEDQKMQVVTTLQSNQSGRQKYSELCKRQEHLRELQKEGGPKKLTLPSRATDADVTRLLSCGSYGNLECLSLAFTHVTSACAHQLILLPALRYLNLWATQFGDAGLVIIAEHLDKLQVLNLCETPVSDKGIAAIAAMRNLKKLNLNSTKLSPQTLDTLKQKLPTLQELDVRYTDAW